jgi:cystathionine gamma-synthase
MSGYSTRAIHAGQEPDVATGAVVVPITLSTTFAQTEPGVHKGYEYSRSGNPTRAAYETCMASLEGAEYGFAFSSGLAAEDVIMRLVPVGGEILLGNDAYGGTYRLLAKVHSKEGRTWSARDLSDLENLKTTWPAGVKMVWFETPTNPMLNVYDIAEISKIAHENGALVVVDNTFATSYLQTPLALGADIVVYSATKYIGGHSDVVGGFAACSDKDIAAEIRYLQNAAGAVPSPFDCYMALRGLKTLSVRMERHCDNAEKIVKWLEQREEVEFVYYPRETALKNGLKNQMKRGGGMVSFTLRNGEGAAKKLVSFTKLFTLAESLGAVESLIEHPYSMTHASSVGSSLEVPVNLVRLSVGIEDVEDLLQDLSQAFDKLN